MFRPSYKITSLLLNLISESAVINSKIASSLIDVSWLPHLQQESTLRMAHSSTAIEGNPLNLSEVAAIQRGELLACSNQSIQEIKNYLAAMKWIWSQKPSGSVKFSETKLLKLHKLITQSILPKTLSGHYKKKANKIFDHNGFLLHTPPPPAKVQELTLELLDWLNGAAKELHPIMASAIAHHRLVSIHPFMDGNGRVSRAFGTWILCMLGFDANHVLTLDECYHSDREKYYQKIQQARDLDDDLTYWLEYVATGVVQTLKNVQGRIEALNIKHSLKEKIRLTQRQEEVLRFMRGKGRVKSPDLEKEFGITRARVGQIIQPLVQANILIREGQTRATTYRLA